MSIVEYMNSGDVLNYALAVGFLVLVGFISYVCYQLALVLKSTHYLINKTEQGVEQAVENATKPGLLNTLLGIGTMIFANKTNK